MHDEKPVVATQKFIYNGSFSHTKNVYLGARS